MSLVVVADNTKEINAQLSAAFDRALERIGAKAERYAREMAPKDTGRLKNSITHAVKSGEKSVYIGTNVEYAPYQELGTSRISAHPFLVPAAVNYADEYRGILESELRK